jgi:hypothetical protein
VSTIAWRRILLGLCTFALLQLGVAMWMQTDLFAAIPAFTAIGFVGESAGAIPTRTPFLHSLTIAPSSPAHHAGLRSGDLVDLRLLFPGDRYRWTTGWCLRGGRVDLPVSRGNAVRHVTLVTRWYPMTLST